MAEMIDEAQSIESTTVGVYRTAATVKGGRRFSFSSMVVVGDRNGRVGLGYGKADQVPPAIEKAQKEAKRRLMTVPLQGRTIPHAVTGRYGACEVRLLPASPGTGVIAGAAVRAPLELLGISDCLTKSYGSTNPKNLVKAVLNGLEQLREKSLVNELRGVDIGLTQVEEAIQRGEAFMTAHSGAARAPRLPAASQGRPSRGPQQGKGRGGKPGQRGDRRGGGRGPEFRAPERAPESRGPDNASPANGSEGGASSDAQTNQE